MKFRDVKEFFEMRGLTTVEVAMVVLIISILVALAIPAFQKVREAEAIRKEKLQHETR